MGRHTTAPFETHGTTHFLSTTTGHRMKVNCARKPPADSETYSPTLLPKMIHKGHSWPDLISSLTGLITAAIHLPFVRIGLVGRTPDAPAEEPTMHTRCLPTVQQCWARPGPKLWSRSPGPTSLLVQAQTMRMTTGELLPSPLLTKVEATGERSIVDHRVFARVTGNHSTSIEPKEAVMKRLPVPCPHASCWSVARPNVKTPDAHGPPERQMYVKERQSDAKHTPTKHRVHTRIMDVLGPRKNRPSEPFLA